mgnify:CR=1 FL=1
MNPQCYYSDALKILQRGYEIKFGSSMGLDEQHMFNIPNISGRFQSYEEAVEIFIQSLKVMHDRVSGRYV